jgi:aminoglycoside phosphotransferase (APT) family kinase protein
MNDALDREALEAWLVDHLAGFSGPLFVERFSGAQSNPTFLLSTNA